MSQAAFFAAFSAASLMKVETPIPCASAAALMTASLDCLKRIARMMVSSSPPGDFSLVIRKAYTESQAKGESVCEAYVDSSSVNT